MHRAADNAASKEIGKIAESGSRKFNTQDTSYTDRTKWCEPEAGDAKWP